MCVLVCGFLTHGAMQPDHNTESRNLGNIEANILTIIIRSYRTPYYIYTIKEPKTLL